MAQFNKMMIMIPVMLAARKLDSEDPGTVKLLRICYGVMQTICVLIVMYAYVTALKVSSNQIIYVPPAPQPFADPNAKKKYTEIAYSHQVISTARSLLGSTLFGIVLTCALHYYKGMTMGLAIQTVMAPLNLWENALVRAILTTGGGVKGLTPENAIFDEKKLTDLTPNDEIVDEQGNPVVRSTTAAGGGGAIQSSKKSLEDVMLDTWDFGAKADVAPLLAALNESNVNTQTEADKWTALMILAGLNCPGNVAAIQKVRDEYKADVTITDKDGWNCLHWAAFHNSLSAATELQNETALLNVKDKEGKTPAETARAEGNNEIADLLEKAAKESKKSQ